MAKSNFEQVRGWGDYVPSQDGLPFEQMLYWIRQVNKNEKLIARGDKTSAWPDGYLITLSVIVGFREANEVLDEEVAIKAEEWKKRAADPQTGKFDGVELFRLMRSAEMEDNERHEGKSI